MSGRIAAATLPGADNSPVGGQIGHRETFLLKLLRAVQHGFMLYHRGNQMPALILVKLRRTLDGELSDSVAPESNRISLGHSESGQPPDDEPSTASSAFQPDICDREAGLPKFPSRVRHSIILAATLESTGLIRR